MLILGIIGEIYLLMQSLTAASEYKAVHDDLSANPYSNPPYVIYEADLASKFNDFFFGATSTCKSKYASSLNCVRRIKVFSLQHHCTLGFGPGSILTAHHLYNSSSVKHVMISAFLFVKLMKDYAQVGVISEMRIVPTQFVEQE
jgi:hypothetical protein